MLSLLLSIGLIINEVMASNVDGTMSPATNFDSWIELYNPTATDIALAGMRLSDGTTVWTMPADMGTVAAGGFKVVWLGSNDIKPNQAPFKLDCDGGTIMLSDADGKMVASADYPEALSRTSWARTTDGGDRWAWTDQSTPGSGNASATFPDGGRLDAPAVDTDSRLFSGAVDVNVTIPEGCTLHYTTDGSLPTASSPVSATGNFHFTKTTGLRLRLYADDCLPSVPVTRSYIAAQPTSLPVVSIVSDDRYLNDSRMGIAVKGSNGKPGRGSSSACNWNMPWERPVHFTYIPADGQPVFGQDVEASISGGWTRNDNPKSYKLKSGKEFDGQNNLLYPFFPDKPSIRNKTLLMRNGGNDNVDGSGGGQYKAGRFRDAAMQEVLRRSGIDLDLQSYVPVVEYINGKRIGVINMREPNNKKYVASNYGYDDDLIDMFEMSSDSNIYMMVGSAEMLERIYQLSEKANLTTNYNEIRRLLDIDEYINYMAMQLFLCSKDWPHNNLKAFRPQRPDGRYRYITFDLDLILRVNDPFTNFEGEQWYTFNEIYETHERRHEEIRQVTLFLNLLQNTIFLRQFIDTYCLMAGSVFDYERTEAILNELADRVRQEMAVDGMSADSSRDFLLNGLRGHATKMLDCMQAYEPMGLENAARYELELSANIPGARLEMNNVEVPYGAFRGEVFAPVRLKAEAPGGYRFAGWRRTFQNGQTELFDMNTDWRYYDQGDLTGCNWNQRAFNDNSWSEGAAPLGYKMSGVRTQLDYGGNANEKRPTYYFRKAVVLRTKPTEADVFTLRYRLDDAMIVYVNGVEAARINLPDGDIGYDTYSTQLVGNAPLEGTVDLPASLFSNGRNIIAVEVHNWLPTSGDIFWAAQLLQSTDDQSDAYFATAPQIVMPQLNRQHFEACFEPLTDEERQADGMTPLRINEVSASNDMAVNDYWKRADWLEIYNTTDADIDLAGCYLSDNPDNPQKWQVDSEGPLTVVPAHGHLVVWCDKQPSLTQLHAPFKLSAEGTVLLTAADGSWVDRLTYTAHEGDQSVGRYPDGAAAVFHFPLPTIAARNRRSSYAVAVEQPNASGVSAPTLMAHQQPTVSVSCAAGQLIVCSSVADMQFAIDIFRLSGQPVARHTGNLANGYCAIPLSTLSRGCYIARVKTSDGYTSTCKFILD